MVSTQPVLAQVQLTGSPTVVSQDLFDISQSGSQQTLGDFVRTNDGRSFRYGQAGAVAAAPGKLYQAPAETTAHEILSVAAAAIGTNVVTTTSTVTVTANQYAFGYLGIAVTPDSGRLYPIQSHPAATAGTLAITLNSPLDVALTTASKVSLIMNPWYGLIVNPTTATSAPVGVAVVNLPTNYYGWFQTGGVANVLADGSTTVGIAVVASTSVAGAVKGQVAGGSSVTAANIGIAYQTGTDTDYCPVYLQLD